MADDARNRLPYGVRLARDTVYVGIGFGVLGFQKFQVRRREVDKQLDAYAERWGEPAGTVLRGGRAVANRVIPFSD